MKVNRLLLGNTAVVGVASREFFDQQPTVAAGLWRHLTELLQAGALSAPPVRVYPFRDARDALHAIAGRRALGKIVLSRRTPVRSETGPAPT